MKKRCFCLLIVIVLLTVSVLSVNAAGGGKAESVLLMPRRIIVYNGVEQVMHDADGERVYPLSYDGTTYLPIRAVCNMLGLKVEWSGDTDTVTLLKKAEGGGAQESETVYAASADAVRRTIDAVNTQDWDQFIDLQAEENQQDYRRFAANPSNAEKHTGLFNILSAKIVEIKELPLAAASALTEIDSYQQKYLQVAAYYIGVDYTVYQETEDYFNGVNYELVITVFEDGAWKIAEMSNAPIEILIDKGYGFGSADERIALNRFYLRTDKEETGAEEQTVNALWVPHRIIYYNGIEQVMRSADGERIYPLSYKDTTYLPIRAIGDMLEMNMEWDGETNTVSILEGAAQN